ncbi:MAG: hypothetical protein MZU84_02245 [Sphingobacterium sp.]|nr:hypothetical protein [Sphingobacterium sp.]
MARRHAAVHAASALFLKVRAFELPFDFEKIPHAFVDRPLRRVDAGKSMNPVCLPMLYSDSGIFKSDKSLTIEANSYKTCVFQKDDMSFASHV